MIPEMVFLRPCSSSFPAQAKPWQCTGEGTCEYYMGRGSPSSGPAALSVRIGSACLATLERIAESCLVKSLWKMENALRMGSSGTCRDVLRLLHGCGVVKDDPDPPG